VTLLLLTPQSAPLAQDSGTFLLENIRVEGSKRYETSEIVRATSLKLGQSATLEDLKKAAAELGSVGVFAQVAYRYKSRGNTLTADFTVQDAPKLFPCTFDNFLWFSPEELTQGLRSHVPLFNGYVPAGGKMLDLIAAQLVAMLEARGIHAQVQYSPVGALGGPVQGMQFRETGVPLPIRKIEFPGASKVDQALLQEVARPLIDMDLDRSYIRGFSHGAIAAIYRRRGYLRVQFGDPLPHLMAEDPTPNAVAVIIPVSEGEQYRLKEIAWSGESVIPYADLGKTLHAEVGSPVNAVQLEQDVLGLTLLFHPKGYLMADAKSEAILDDATHLAVYQIQIRQGDLYRLGKLEIAGLDEAYAASLERRSRLRPGDPYDSAYWNRFLQEVGRQLPASSSGWKLNPAQTIHTDTKTVDVRLVFTAGGGP
jgi:outer membrane protein insertion porin family